MYPLARFMKAISIGFILEDKDAEYFITQVLPKLKKEHNLKQVHYHKCEYFEK